MACRTQHRKSALQEERMVEECKGGRAQWWKSAMVEERNGGRAALQGRVSSKN
ncbi:MAG TPA: hypothetical protein VHA06_13535 [Candidatus Angelobacter sp.]|nr:hypothetical protein [Candidatus Angelobacter sp.]